MPLLKLLKRKTTPNRRDHVEPSIQNEIEVSRVSYLAGWLVVKVAHSFTTLSGVVSVMSCHWYVGAWDIDFLLSIGSQLSSLSEGWISTLSPPAL